jgi:drug/metabolite transporter (DMT)-like permease
LWSTGLRPRFFWLCSFILECRSRVTRAVTGFSSWPLLGPMLLGHTAVNYALRYTRAYVANLAVLGEPVGATLIAWLLPAIAEPPSLHTLIGGGIILFGIAVTLAGTRRVAGG